MLSPRLYKLYWPYTCPHCGHKGLVREKDWRCKNFDCRKDVVPDEYESLEDQEARWREEGSKGREKERLWQSLNE
jgi:hypothetical protein